ncbi:zinc finger protein 850 [Silurus meridionalis]|nr:zinc finger protein 850 [Silurus meridionalis]
MASASQKRKIDSLNAFIHQRLNNIAGEICQVFQETLAAYQEEINQSKQENVHLRNMLAEFTLHRTDRIDAQTSQADGFPPEKQNLSQASMDPEASVIQVKLELSTTQQDLELPKQSCPTLACSPAASDRDKDTSPDREISDEQRSHTDGVSVPLKQPTFSQEPQNCNPSQIQVKLEPFTGHESEERLNNTSSFCSSPARIAGTQGSPHSFSLKPANVQAKKAHCSSTRSAVAVTSKPLMWNRTGSSSNISCTPGKSETRFEPAIKNEPVQPASQFEKPPNDVSPPKSRLQGQVPYRSFYCDMCRKAFQNEWQLKRHLLKHQNKRPNCCELCGKCYSTPHVLKIHFRTHTGERPYHCKFCEKTFSQIGHLKGHERIHTGEKIYSCSVCGKCFTWLSQAKEHIRSHPDRLLAVAGELFQAVTDVISEYQKETDRTKQENMVLKKMLKAQRLASDRDGSTNEAVPQKLPNISHGPLDSDSSVIQVKVELSTTKQDIVPPEPINDPITVTSPHCFSKKTTSEDTKDDFFNDHLEIKIKSEPMDSQIVISNDSNPPMQSESTSDCNLEGERDDQGLDLSSHDEQQNETVDRIVYCQYCGKPFRNRGQMKRHMVVHQKDRPRPYCCDLCGKCYSYAQVLEVHRRTHTGERPYHCKYCGRRFNQKGHLKEHERIHTGEKPFGCPICGKRFIQSSQVRKHVKYHHPTVKI